MRVGILSLSPRPIISCVVGTQIIYSNPLKYDSELLSNVLRTLQPLRLDELRVVVYPSLGNKVIHTQRLLHVVRISEGDIIRASLFEEDLRKLKSLCRLCHIPKISVYSILDYYSSRSDESIVIDEYWDNKLLIASVKGGSFLSLGVDQPQLLNTYLSSLSHHKTYDILKAEDLSYQDLGSITNIPEERLTSYKHLGASLFSLHSPPRLSISLEADGELETPDEVSDLPANLEQEHSNVSDQEDIDLYQESAVTNSENDSQLSMKPGTLKLFSVETSTAPNRIAQMLGNVGILLSLTTSLVMLGSFILNLYLPREQDLPPMSADQESQYVTYLLGVGDYLTQSMTYTSQGLGYFKSASDKIYSTPLKGKISRVRFNSGMIEVSLMVKEVKDFNDFRESIGKSYNIVNIEELPLEVGEKEFNSQFKISLRQVQVPKPL